MRYKCLSFPLSFFILCFFINQVQIPAQDRKIVFEHFTVLQGLPSDAVPTIFQDRTGYLWIGTFYGIARYDGYSMVSYTNREGDSASITNSIVNAICDDSEGNIWFGHSHGLDKFDPSTEKFTHYILNPERPIGDWSQHVLSLREDKTGTLWIGTGSGLYTFDKSKGAFTWIQHDSTDPNSISSNSINSIYEDRAGTLWFGTGKGLNKYDKAANRFVHYFFPPDNPYDIISILEDNEGVFWLGTAGALVEFNPQTGKFILYQNEPGNKESLANNIVISICEDRSGQFWISTKEGVDLFNKKKRVFTHYKHNDQEPGSISSNDGGRIICDRSGAVWISTYGGGINKFTPPDPYFRYYSTADIKSNRFPSVEIIEDKKGKLWLGTGQGIFKFDPGTETFERLAADKEIYLLMPDAEGSMYGSVREMRILVKLISRDI